MAAVDSIEGEAKPTSSTDETPKAVAAVVRGGVKEVLRRTFFGTLRNERMLEVLWEKITVDYATWTGGNNFVAPFFTIVESSGCGKSRLVCELHRKGVYIVYVSCMEPHKVGFPGRTPHLAAWITRERPTETQMAALLLASIEALGDHLKSKSPPCDPQSWILDQTDPDRGFPVAHQIATRLKACQDRLESCDSSRGVEEALGTAIRRLPLEGVAGPREDRLKVLFCFDEANVFALDPRFPLLRRALSRATSGVWALVLGTDPLLLKGTEDMRGELR